MSTRIDQNKLPRLVKMMRKGIKPEVARQQLKIPAAKFDAYIKAYVKKARKLLIQDMKNRSVIVHPNWRAKLLSVMGIKPGVVGRLKYVKFIGKTPFQHTALHMAGYSLHTVTRGATAIGLRRGASIYVAPQTTKRLSAAELRAAKAKATKIFARLKGRYAYGLPRLKLDKGLKVAERKILAQAGYARLRIPQTVRGLPKGVYWISPSGVRKLGIKDTSKIHHFAFQKSSAG